MSEENKVEEGTKQQAFRMFSSSNYEDLQNMLNVVNAVDRLDIFNLPQQVSAYYNVEDNNTATELTNMLFDAERDESWRMRKFGLQPNIIINLEKKTISFIDSQTGRILNLYDVKGYIIVAELQMIVIIPGDETIKQGDFRPDEVIRLHNLLLYTALFCQMKNIPVEGQEGQWHVGFEMKIVNNKLPKTS